MAINGIINIKKEKGYTSHDVVAKMRGILKQKKIGHTGTLDPDATGVLPVCLGSATKLCDMLTDKTKEYRTTFCLGIVTDTQDISGKCIEKYDVKTSESEVMETINSFLGKSKQIPPMYSAIKVNGKKLYELAREGKVVDRKPRDIEIFNVEVEKISLPYITMKVECSKGTYIRTLCNDIGARLKTGATMTELERTRVGEFNVDRAITLAELEDMVREDKLMNTVMCVEDFFCNLKAIKPKLEFERFLTNGNRLYDKQIETSSDIKDEELVRVYTYNGDFVAIYQYKKNDGYYKPYQMFFDN